MMNILEFVLAFGCLAVIGLIVALVKIIDNIIGGGM